jgi:hypothetical protein
MSRLCLSIFLTTMLSLQLYAQTSNELAAKYKKFAVYEVRPGIMMTASFGDNGQVCEMVLQQNRFSQRRADLGDTISPKLIDKLVDELVPAGERGAEIKDDPKQSFVNGFVSGNIYQVGYNYVNVSIYRLGGIFSACSPGEKLVIIRWKNGTCPQSSRESRTANTTPSNSSAAAK